MLKGTTAKYVAIALCISAMFNVFACGEKEGNDCYTVTFQDYDGKILKIWQSNSGEALSAPEVSLRKGYEFSGWDKNVTDITSNATVTAQYFIVKNQLFFDYEETETCFSTTLSICGDVQVCGFEATLLYRTEDLVLEEVKLGENLPCEVNFQEQSDKTIKMFFFHDQIDNIIEPFDIFVVEFAKQTEEIDIEFILDVTICVDKDFVPVTFNVANTKYQG